MSFLDSLRKMFIYTGELDDEHSSDNIKPEVKPQTKPRLDIGNPIQRIKDVKVEAMSAIRNSGYNSKPSVTEFTKNLIYESMYKSIEPTVGKSKPLVEAKILFRRFLEEKVTDEAMYSDEDLEYITALVSYIKKLKSIGSSVSTTRDELIEVIKNSPYFLNMMEILDIRYEYDFIQYFCDCSYIMCGCQYKNKGNLLGYLKSVKTPYFALHIGDAAFYILNEVSSIISDEDTDEKKREYIVSKCSPFINRYVITKNVDVRVLYIVVELFKHLEVVTTSPTESKQEIPISEVKKQPPITDEEIHEKIFEGSKKQVHDPIQDLKQQSEFITKYAPLADGRNPNVTVEELEKAIEEIDKIIFFEFEDLSDEENKIYQTIKARLRLLKGGA